MLSHGEDPLWVARMLGHSGLDMIFKHYGKFIRNRPGRTGEGFCRDSKRLRHPPTGRCESGDEDEIDDFTHAVDNTGYTLYHSAVTGKELIQRLKALGWVSTRIEGSDHILVRGPRTISVPATGRKT